MQHQIRTGPDATNTQAPFTNSMSNGYQPPSPRIFLGPRIPLPLAQTTHVQAPFTNSMSAGWVPPKAVLGKPYPQGWSIAQTSHVQAPFTPDMVSGWHSDTQRSSIYPKLGWLNNDGALILVPVVQLGANLILVDGQLAKRLHGIIYVWLD